jgi:hypothetical protein
MADQSVVYSLSITRRYLSWTCLFAGQVLICRLCRLGGRRDIAAGGVPVSFLEKHHVKDIMNTTLRRQLQFLSNGTNASQHLKLPIKLA